MTISQLREPDQGATTPIPVNDLRRHSRAVSSDVRAAVERVLASGWYVLGPECAGFEREFAAYCGADHCIGVASGTDALELCLRGLGIGPETRVATVANAGGYTSTALTALGATPVFVDVDPTSRLMDLNALAALAEAGAVDAVVMTHLFGLMHDVVTARSIVDRAGIPLVEDCAQAHGASRGGRKAGSIGDAACFSFYPTKNLGAVGDGGAVVTNNAILAARVRSLRQYGWEAKYRAVLEGGRNSRLDEIQAAVLRAKLPYLDQWNARRREIADRYADGIRHPRVSCPQAQGEEFVAHLYVVECDNPMALREHLAEVGILSDVHYPVPDHAQPSAARKGPWPPLPVTERLAREILTLPCFPELTDGEVDRIICHVNAW